MKVRDRVEGAKRKVRRLSASIPSAKLLNVKVFILITYSFYNNMILE
jgi:hypothetical protein